MRKPPYTPGDRFSRMGYDGVVLHVLLLQGDCWRALVELDGGEWIWWIFEPPFGYIQ